MPRRHTALHLRVDSEDLKVGRSDARGELIEIEAVWEPLGWVVEDWVETIAVAPSEHTAISDMAVDGTSRTVGAAADEVRSRAGSDESSTVSTQDVMQMATNVLTSGSGVYAGLNREPSVTSVDPVASLAQAVTGTLQLGYSSARATTAAEYGGDVRRELESAIQRVTTQLRSSRSRLSSDSVGRLLEQRRLRVIRNPSVAHTLNLAVFSVARQWRVRTREARRAPVVFVAVEDVSKPFDADEVFRYRTVLSGVLLDPQLVEPLNRTAARHLRTPADGVRLLTGIEGRVTFSDAPMRGSWVSITVQARRVGEAMHPLDADMPSSIVPGQGYRFPIATSGYQETELSAVLLTMHANQNGLDRRAEISDLQLFAVFSDGTRTTLLDLENRLELLDGRPRLLPLPRPPAAPVDPEAEEDRVLTHLDAHRHYYRLAIDLQRDAVSRFVALTGREPPVPVLPLDMNPVGVAGAHIAFLCAEADREGGTGAVHRRHDVDEGTEVMLTTPSDGVLVETVPGAGAASVDADAWRPSDLPMADGGFVWPSPVAGFPAAPAVPTTGGGADPAPPEGAAPASSAEPVTKPDLEELAKSLTSMLPGLIADAMGAASAQNGADPAAGKT